MKRPVTAAFCFVLLLVGITILVSRSATPAHAQQECVVPKAFGTLRGASTVGLLFEAPNGTIRIYGSLSCQVAGTIKRQ
jgi:hypothetical protein